MTTSDWILAINAVALLLAPIVALYIGGILQRRSDARNSKLAVFSTLMAIRHDPFSLDSVKALNSIDAVFAHDAAVREAWTRYLIALNDSNMNAGPGYSIREERRRDLLLAMVKSLRLSHKISSAELMRTYMPTFAAEITHLDYLDRLHRKAVLEEDLTNRHVPFVPWPTQPVTAPPTAVQPNPPTSSP